MIAVVRCYKHITMATILSRRDNCEYRVMVEYWVAFGNSAK